MIESGQRRGRLEMWGGLECSRVRVRDRYHDQLQWSGHDLRPQDLESIAELGIRTLRYPLLWEQAAPDDPARFDWTWADQRLPYLRRLGIRPIAGLVHHGSGPVYTQLLDENFPALLAKYAGKLAARFPWVDAYTPVNEPLTTARFSALYGHWYPHLQDSLPFARALLNECKAIVLAMRAIRLVRPDAELIQTEDMGEVYSRPALAYQAQFENERRWLTFDLLCGRIDRHHPMGNFLEWLGIPASELAWFQENACPPDILGINHYVTSHRFLDDRIGDYPAWMCGGNDRHRYVDTEAVRTVEESLPTPGDILQAAWKRYERPVAITESHLGCSREEQARWLWYVWNSAKKARVEGADVRAVTSWALLGVYDWDRLMTQPRGYYEPGALDLRGPRPRKTLVGHVAQSLAQGKRPKSPVLDHPGWWQRPDRFLHSRPFVPLEVAGRPLLIAGANGTLGYAFSRICSNRSLKYQPLRRADMDIADRESVDKALKTFRPWGVINASGYVRVNQAEVEVDRCERENTHGASVLAEACQSRRIPLMTFSTHLVFDGEQTTPYCEGDKVNPLSVYGRTKATAERNVMDGHAQALIIRTSAFFGPWDKINFVTRGLAALAAGEPFLAADDLTVTPTYVPDLVHASLDLLLDGATGIWHLAGPNAVSWAELGRLAAERGGFDPARVNTRSANSLQGIARRPVYSALGSTRGTTLPDLGNALGRYFRDQEPRPLSV